MDTKTLKKPYAVYDVLAYLIPGGVLCVGVAYYMAALWGSDKVTAAIAGGLKPVWPNTWYEFGTVLLAALFLIYVLGHIVSLASAMFIDSFIVRRVHGYPFETMLGSRFATSRFDLYKKMLATGSHGFFLIALILLAYPKVRLSDMWFFFGASAWLGFVRLTFGCYPRESWSRIHALFLLARFVLFTLIAVGVGMWGYVWLTGRLGDCSFWFMKTICNWFLWTLSFTCWQWIVGALVAIVACLAGCLVMHVRISGHTVSLSRAFRNQKEDLKKLYCGTEGRDARFTDLDKPLSLAQYVVLLLAAVPGLVGCLVYYILSKPLFAITGIYRPMESAFVTSFCECCDRVFEIADDECKNGCALRNDLYWLTTCYLTEHTEKHNLNIRHWLSLYGFARNLSMAFFALFLMSAILRRSLPEEALPVALRWWPLVTGVLTALLLHRYLYLYFKYYSKYIARAFVTEVKARKYLRG